jgi:acyl dehydratase
MVELGDIEVGQVIRNEFDDITRELLRDYASASGDTNPIHTRDDVAEKAGLKGVIAHGLFSLGFLTKMFEDFLNLEKDGKLIEVDVDMVGMVRCGDTLITEGTVKEINGKRVFLDVVQRTITPVHIKDSDGNIVKEFEAGERGYISEKDRKRDLLHQKEVEKGTLTYRDRVATKGRAIIELNQ